MIAKKVTIIAFMTMLSISYSYASKCNYTRDKKADYVKSPRELLDFIDKEVGLSNFLNENIDWRSKGFVRNTNLNSLHFCSSDPNSLCLQTGKVAGKFGHHYSQSGLTNLDFDDKRGHGLYSMRINKVLDGRFHLGDVAEAVGRQVRLPTKTDGWVVIRSKKIEVNEYFVAMSIYVKDYIGGEEEKYGDRFNTRIEYEFINNSFWLEKQEQCERDNIIRNQQILRESEDARKKGKTLEIR